VVLLFNAVNKAQKQKKEAEAAGIKGRKAKVNKAGFFAELKAGAAAAAARTLGADQASLVAGQTAAAAGGTPAGPQRAQQQPHAAAAGAGHGWDVLGEGFPGLTGGVKMKDWDKAATGSDEAPNGHALAGSDDEDDDGPSAW